MLMLIAAVIAGVAFIVLFRLLWLNAKPGRYGTIITVAAVVLVLALAALAATGRLHWLAALGAALLPFLRRAFGLLRYLPFIGSLLARFRQAHAQGAGQQGPHGSNRRPAGSGDMGRQEALDILGLGSHPTREEVVSAHRRLMQKIHPDRGGSTYLAKQLNEAKRVLLKELGG